jgi:hypothetical protein
VKRLSTASNLFVHLAGIFLMSPRV